MRLWISLQVSIPTYSSWEVPRSPVGVVQYAALCVSRVVSNIPRYRRKSTIK